MTLVEFVKQNVEGFKRYVLNKAQMRVYQAYIDDIMVLRQKGYSPSLIIRYINQYEKSQGRKKTGLGAKDIVKMIKVKKASARS